MVRLMMHPQKSELRTPFVCRGERELFQMVDVASGFEQSIYDDRHTAKGETSILQVTFAMQPY